MRHRIKNRPIIQSNTCYHDTSDKHLLHSDKSTRDNTYFYRGRLGFLAGLSKPRSSRVASLKPAVAGFGRSSSVVTSVIPSEKLMLTEGIRQQ